MNTRGREGILIGTGAGLMLIVLVVLQSLIGSGLLSTRTVTVTSTTTAVSTVPGAYDQVAGTYANRLLLLDSRNVSALTAGYEDNATVVWEGMPGMSGSYTGSLNITDLLHLFLIRDGEEVFSVYNETQTMGSEGNYWVVNLAFDFVGNSSIYGKLGGMIAAQDSFVHVGSTWLIVKESWNFLKYDEQYPVG